MAEVIEKVDNIESNKNLKNTIELDDGFYNINAVEADVAKKTQAVLTITRSIKGNDTDTTEAFDGNEDRLINYVPADGGVFTGSVQINKNKYSVADVSLDDVINRGQMETVISKLDGAPLYTWDVNTGYNVVENADKVPYKLNTVIGTVEDLPVFEAYSEGKAHSRYIALDNADKNHVSYDTTKSTEYVVAYFTPAYNSEKNTITKLVIPGTYSSGNIANRPIKIDKLNDDIPAFQELTALETVHINPGVTEIGQTAFKGCTALKFITIPDSVASIGGWAFEDCTSLTTVILGSQITEIRNGTFKNAGLKSIFIGSNVNTIHSKAFLGAPLEKVYFAGTKEAWNNIKDESNNANPLLNIPVICIDDAHHPAAPFLYVCKGASSEDTSLTSNKMFLKLPGQALVEVSKGAARLERWDSKPSNNTDYFTYDVLAAVIAAINNRITALAGQKLALPTTLNVSGIEHTAVPELSDDISSAEADKALIVEETDAPSVYDLQEQITAITGGTYTDESYKDTVLKAKADEADRNIQTGYYQKTLNSFTSSSYANTITISESIPTDSTPGQIGDIMIVINAGDGE